jgi:hypothetical protein
VFQKKIINMANENFSKWQERTQNLRTHSISVFQGITLATIGFIINQILDKDFAFRNRYVSIFLVFALAILLITSVIVLSLIINRLNGFRLTTQIARMKDVKDTEEKESLREQSLNIDSRTHVLFKISLIFFSIGETFAVVGFAIQLWPKLSPSCQ